MLRVTKVFLLVVSIILCGNLLVNAICGDIDGNFMVFITDVTFLQGYVFGSGSAPASMTDANVDGYGTVNIGDAIRLNDYLFGSGTPLSCAVPQSYVATISSVDTVRIGNPPYTIYGGGDSMAIPIYLTNATTITGFTFGFTYSTSDISITSISTAGAIVTVSPNIDAPGGKIQLSYAFQMTPLAPQSSGLIATLNAQIVTPGVDQYVDVDSSFVPPAGDFIFVDNSISVLCPEFVKAEASSGCCVGIRGNFNGDELDEIDIGDLVYMAEYQFPVPPDSNPAPPCFEEGDIAPIEAPDGTIDIGDLVAMVEYQFADPPGTGSPPPDCP